MYLKMKIKNVIFNLKSHFKLAKISRDSILNDTFATELRETIETTAATTTNISILSCH